MAEKECLKTWPSWMPKPQRSGYTYGPVDRRKKTDMEVGSVLRVEYDTDECTCDCTLILDRMQSTWFESFERGLMRQGSEWFRMPLMFGGCIDWQTVRFASRPKASEIIGVRYTSYTFTLDVYRRENLFECDVLTELLMCISPYDFLEAVINIRKFVMGLPNLTVPSIPEDI